MIRKYKETETEKIFSDINADFFKNIYAYLDIYEYGLSSDKTQMWILSENDKTVSYIYQYYNTLQLFALCDISEEGVSEICEFMQKQNIVMLSGEGQYVKKLSEKNSGYSDSYGVLMTYEGLKLEPSSLTELAREDDYNEIAALICSDKDIGGHYAPDVLCAQMKDRLTNHNCKGVVIRQDDKIVSHISVYAQNEKISVFGGLVTDNNYRSKGYGKAAINALTEIVLNENKLPVLFCFNKDTADWYKSLGWVTASKCGRLKKRT